MGALFFLGVNGALFFLVKLHGLVCYFEMGPRLSHYIGGSYLLVEEEVENLYAVLKTGGALFSLLKIRMKTYLSSLFVHRMRWRASHFLLKPEGRTRLLLSRFEVWKNSTLSS